MKRIQISLGPRFYMDDYILQIYALEKFRGKDWNSDDCQDAFLDLTDNALDLLTSGRLIKVDADILEGPPPGLSFSFTWRTSEATRSCLEFVKGGAAARDQGIAKALETWHLSATCDCPSFSQFSACEHLIAASYVVNSKIRHVVEEKSGEQWGPMDGFLFDGDDLSFESVLLPQKDKNLLGLKGLEDFLKAFFSVPELKPVAVAFLNYQPAMKIVRGLRMNWPKSPDFTLTNQRLHADHIRSNKEMQFIYLFSDGVWKSWHQIRSSRNYRRAMPNFLNPELREKGKDKIYYQGSFSWWFEACSRDYLVGGIPPFYMGEISLLNDLELLQKENISFYLGVGKDHQYTCDYDLFKINEVYVERAKDHSSNIKLSFEIIDKNKAPSLKFSSSWAGSDSMALDYGFFNPKEGRLEILSSAKNRAMENLFNSHSLLNADWTFQVKAEAQKNPYFLSFQLPFSSESEFNLWSLMNAPWMQALNANFDGDLEKAGGLKKILSLDLVNREVKFSQGLSLNHDRDLFLPHLGGLAGVPFFLTEGAWAGILGNSGPNVASRGVRRQQDLKFLRHTGSLAYACLEVLHFRFFARVLDVKEQGVKTHNDLLDYLLVKLPFFVFPDKVEALDKGKSLSFFVSDRVASLIKKWLDGFIKSYFQEDSSTVLACGEKFISFRASALLAGEIFLLDLLTLAEGRGYSLFKKMTDRVFSQMPSRLMCDSEMASEYRIKKNMDSFKALPLGQQGDFLPIWLENAKKLGYEIWFNDRPMQTLIEGDVEFKLNFSDNKKEKWFELNPEVYFRGKRVELNQTEKIAGQYVILFEDQYYVIDGRTLPRYNQVLRIWEKLFVKKDKKDYSSQETLALPVSAQVELISLLLNGVQVSNEPRFEEMASYIHYMDNRKELSTEVQDNRQLLAYQKVGVQWLLDMKNLHLGAILADEMGLGKTAQAIAALDLMPMPGKPHLVVMPTSLVYNWQHEIKKFSRRLVSHVINSREDLQFDAHNPDLIILTSYGMLTEHKDLFLEKNWGALVFDEAHYLKNASSERFKTASLLKADWRLAITGTPLENKLAEFETLLGLVLEGVPHGLKRDDAEMLKAVAKPFVLRRRKSEVGLQLPEKIEESVVLPTDDVFKSLYKKTTSALNEQVSALIEKEGEKKTQLHILAALTKLRQLCSDPRILKDYKGDSLKNEFLLEKIQECLEAGNSVLVFTQFLTTLDYLERDIKKFSLPFLRIDGSTPQRKRQEIIENFQNSESPFVLALTLKTGGVGLNLTRANFVFHIDPWWNPAVENQATDRVHRLGQTRNVTSYRLVLKDTLEEKIETLKKEKLELFKSLFDSDEEVMQDRHRLLSREDFKFLVSTQN